jgi:GT2 family glycosyltransferase
MPAPVIVVIPNFNGARLLGECVGSALGQTLPSLEVLVVDDASTDESSQLATSLGARVLALGRNQGFAHAVNAGVLDSPAEWVAIVNTDVTLAPDWIARLLGAAQAARAEYASGPITRHDDPGVLDGGYDLLSRAACPWRAGSGFPVEALRVPDGPWLPSLTALLIRRQTFIDAGLLDETFGSYLEDVDFALRLHRRAVPGVFVPEARAAHRGSATFGAWSARATRLQSRNQALLIARHYPQGWVAEFGQAVFAGQMLWGALALRHGVAGAWLLGKLDALRSWRRLRRICTSTEAGRLAASFAAWERAILDWQGDPPRDAFWRWYFRLAGG